MIDVQRILDGAMEYHRAGRLVEAGQLYRQVLEVQPDNVDALNLLGVLARQSGDTATAESLLRRAVALAPNVPDIRLNLATALQGQEKREEALGHLEHVQKLQPDLPDTLNNMGALLRELGRDEEAVAYLRRCLAKAPRLAEAHNNLGSSLVNLGRMDEAEASFRRALAFKPGYATACDNLGIVLQTQGRYAEALAAFRRALTIDPQNGDARFHLSVASLLAGDFAAGWSAWEARWQVKPVRDSRRNFSQPQWDGRSLDGRGLLLWGEQGIGDEVLYAGLIDEVRERAGAVVVECDKRAVPLFARSFPWAEIVPRTKVPHPRTGKGDLVAQLPTGSLPGLLRSDFASFRPHKGYLVADAVRAAALRERYRAAGGLVVGVAWRSSRKELAHSKSTRLVEWGPILTVPGVTFVNLQYGDSLSERSDVMQKLGVTVRDDAEIDSLKDLDGFAAQVAAMDLVISTSNTAVHFAGALNVPVWTMLPLGHGLLYYWFLSRDDSPWYPSMRLFRQERRGDWSDVVTRAAAALRALVERRS